MAGTDSNDEPAARKVQRTGGSTFTVSLPKEWASAQDLTAGSTVYLYPFDDRVVVAPDTRRASKRHTVIDVAGLDPGTVARDVRSAYAAGFDVVILEGDGEIDQAHRAAAAEVLTRLVGMQIAQDGPEGLEGRSTLDASAVSLEQTLAQLRQHVLSTLREAVTALETADGEAALSVENRFGEVERLVGLVERQFQGALVNVRDAEQLTGDRSTAYRQIRTAQGLADVGNAAQVLASVAAEQSSPPAAPVDEGVDAAGDAVRAAIRAALGDDRRAARDAVADSQTTLEVLDGALEEVSDPDCHRYGRARAALSRATEVAAEIATLRLGHTQPTNEDGLSGV